MINKKNSIFNKAGVALLYAIIILGGVSLISLAIAGLTIRGLKQGRDVGRGMIAYYAAESGLEQALYSIYVNDNTADGSGSCDETDGDWDYDITDTFNQASPYTQSILPQDKTIEFDNIGTSTQLNLGWSDWDGDTSELVEVTYVGWEDDWANFALNPIDFTQQNQTVLKRVYRYTNLSGGWITPLNLSEANNLVRIKPLQDSISGVQIYFSGFDIEDKIRVVSTGSCSGYKKALEANFSRDSAVSGFFDYVIFSEGNLGK